MGDESDLEKRIRKLEGHSLWATIAICTLFALGAFTSHIFWENDQSLNSNLDRVTGIVSELWEIWGK